jgi:diguanylate cyclase (GGDEF)-like protein
VDRPPFEFALQPDLRLFIWAMTLVLVAGVVAFGVFRRAREGGRGRRLGWLLLAAGSCAFGVWAAHFVSLLAHGSGAPLQFRWPLIALSLASVIVLMMGGFAIAQRGRGWHPAVGGAVNGSSMGIMHYLGMYAVLPGTIIWDMPLVLLSLGLGLGLNGAAFIVFGRTQSRIAVWGAAALLTMGFVGLHFTALRAAHVIAAPGPVLAATAGHHLALAVIITLAALLVLVVSAVAILIDRQTRQDNVQVTQELVDAAIEGIVVVRDGRIVSVNRRAVALCSRPPEALIGKGIVGTVLRNPVPVGASQDAVLITAAGGIAPVKVEHQRLSSGDEVYAIHDLTERRIAEAELQRRNEVLREREEELRSRNFLLDTALKHMSQGLCMYDKDGRIIVCNERYATVYGLPPDAIKPGMTRRQVIETRIAHGIWSASAESYLQQRIVPVTAPAHMINEMNDGRTISLVHVPLPGGGWVCTHEDITERHQAQRKIEHLARHDGLTDLPNRFLLRDELHEALLRLRPGEGLAVHCLDLDRFKEINDTEGHAEGDRLLRAFAAVLSDSIRDSDTVGRLGGDEFGVLLLQAEPWATKAFLDRIAARLPEGVAASAGVAYLAEVQGAPSELFALADRRLYEDKSAHAA